jgi:hypothetical protein
MIFAGEISEGIAINVVICLNSLIDFLEGDWAEIMRNFSMKKPSISRARKTSKETSRAWEFHLNNQSENDPKIYGFLWKLSTRNYYISKLLYFGKVFI